MTIPTIHDYPMPQPASYPANKTTWQPDPARAVLLIHDMQRYFLRFYQPDGALLTALVDNLSRLIQWARAQGIPVVYTAQPHEQPLEDRALLNAMWGPGLPAASPEQQPIIDALAPQPGDTVLTKWRYSAFQRSDLLERMRGWQRDQLLIGGVYAHIGCMITAADAFMNDIQAFLVGDAVADFSEEEHRLALKYVATRCGHVTDTGALLTQPAGETTRDWLHGRVRQMIEDDSDLDPQESLIFYGLDSLQVMKLAAELKQRGIAVSFEELANAPTLDGWWSLVQARGAA
ncbi:isochorismatase [Pseudomonas peradeniyensis]|uniref:isochorismatase n=1 Tax=Pseudomonas peradeniyensis TaxID=2745488 RepID=A0ABT2V6Q7_9PSED|nr:isochorismatase [Pseudomonas peradeniyensis]MCU7237377.1 isochorismatase [Pseudomonas peradeniyensis]